MTGIFTKRIWQP